MTDIVVYCTTCRQALLYKVPKTLPQNPRLWCNSCKKQFSVKKYLNKTRKNSTKDTSKSNFVPPQTKITPQQERVNSSPSPIIDDPDELLYSVAIRELNRAQPDPRWASILIQCRKEIGKRKNEMIDQLQKLPTKQLVEILEKQSGQSSLKESTN